MSALMEKHSESLVRAKMIFN